MVLYNRFPFLNPKYRYILNFREGRLLNLGCGEGLLEKRLKELNVNMQIASVDSLDFRSCLPEGSDFYQLDISKEKLPFDCNTFDVVTMIHVIEHLKEPGFALREILRVLKPNGTFYIEAPSLRSLYLPSINFNLKDGNPINFYDDPSHIRPYSKLSLYRILMDNGFKVKEVRYARDWLSFLISPYLIIKGLLLSQRNLFTWGIWNLVGWSVYAVGEKR